MYTPRPDPPQRARAASRAQSNVLGASSIANQLPVKTVKAPGLAEKRTSSSEAALADGRASDQLQIELDHLCAKLADREAKLAAKESRSSSITELERKLEHLVDKYKASKAKHENELSAVQQEKAALANANDILRHQVKKGDDAAANAVKTLARVTREATEARKQSEELLKKTHSNALNESLAEELAAKLEASEAETERLRKQRDAIRTESAEAQKQVLTIERELAKVKASKSTSSQDTVHDDLVATRATVRTLTAELATTRSRVAELEGINEEQRSDLVEAQEQACVATASLQAAALAYATLHRSSIPLSHLQSVSCELADTRVCNVTLRSTIQQLQQDTKDVQEETDTLREKLDGARARAEDAEALVGQLLAEQTGSRVDGHGDGLAELEREMLELAMEEADWNARAYRESQKCLRQTLVELDDSQQHQRQLLLSLGIVNAELASEASRRKSDEAQLAEAVAKRDEVLESFNVVEANAKEDRAKVESAEVLIARWKVAEVALEEEIEGLRNALTRAARFEEAYAELEGSYRALLSCQAETEDEADRLGKLNSELRGLGGSGRVSYVETVRRESSAVKQELAATRSLLNTAHERIAALSEEIESYRTVGGFDAPKRIRVVRRLPEDGRLGTSVLGKSVAK